MPDKQEKKTKITSGAPAGQVDDGSPTKHQREAKSMDPKNGDGAAEPAKKKTEEKRSPGGIAGILKFLNDVKIEAKKITWPPRSQVINETWSVIVMVAFITFMVLGFDYALGNWIFGPIEHAAKMMAPATPDTLFQEVPGTPTTPDGKPIDSSSTPPTGTPPAGVPVTPAPDATTPTPGTTAPVAPAAEPGSTLPPAGNMPGLPAPTSPSAPSTVPAATTPPVTPPPATTAPAAPATPAPGATTPTSTTAPAPATPATPHP